MPFLTVVIVGIVLEPPVTSEKARQNIIHIKTLA